LPPFDRAKGDHGIHDDPRNQEQITMETGRPPASAGDARHRPQRLDGTGHGGADVGLPPDYSVEGAPGA